jgi:hypothetical protein
VTCAKTSHVSSAEATHVSSAEATEVSSAEATHAASAETTAHVTAATATATATPTTTCLCTRGKQTSGKHGACQYHHHSSSGHVIFLSTGRAIGDRFNVSPCPDMGVRLPTANGKFRSL